MFNHNQRIQLSDTSMTAAIKLAEGNPGAVTAIMELMHKGADIDPDAAFGGMAGLFSLDTGGIYGPRIWQFYSDLCKRDCVRMIGLQRAVQLGMLDDRFLDAAIDGTKPMSLDEIDGYVAKVRERLPNFGRVTA